MTDLETIAHGLVRYRTDPVRFVRGMFYAEPDQWQAEALEAVAAGRNVSIRSGHGVGKTCLLAWITIWYLLTRPHPRIPCTAPTQHQLHDVLWAEIARWLSRALLRPLVEWTATRVGLVGCPETWFAVARACNRPENLAGFHADHLLYIVDEASGVPDDIMQAVDGALTSANAQLVMAGNPTQRSGYFYDSHHRSRALYYTMRVSSEESSRVSPEYAQAMGDKWGRDSDIYRVRVLGEFPLAESAGFIPLDLVEAAVMRSEDVLPAQGVCEIGLDVARFGDDETVFCVRRGCRVVAIEGHRGWRTTETAGRAIALIREHSAQAIKIDDSGVGGGVTDMLVEQSGQLRGCEVVPVNFGGAGDDHYHNAAAVMWGRLREMLQAGEIALPDDEELVAQLTTRRYRMTSAGRIELERKDDAKARGLPSPDRADALALAFGAARAPEPRIRFL